MELHEIRKKVKKELDKNRYEHTKGVMYTAGCLAMANEYPIEKAMLAGLLHDCAKCIPNDEKIRICEKHDCFTQRRVRFWQKRSTESRIRKSFMRSKSTQPANRT